MNEIKAMLLSLVTITFGIGINNNFYCYLGFGCLLVGLLIKLFRGDLIKK